MSAHRPLVVLAHGTADPQGRAVLEQVAQRAAAQVGQPARLGYVDVCGPTAGEVLADVPDAVIVPLFLASGYHVRTDIPAAAAEAPGAVATHAVGSGPAIVSALADRVRAIASAPDGVVLAGAGSSDQDARDEVAAAATLLEERLAVPVRHAFLTASSPTVAEAYASLTGTVVLAAHLLAPGHFHRVLERTAAELGAPVTAPIGDHPQVAAKIVARYRRECAT